MASERLLRISPKAVWTGSASPSVWGPFLFSQVGHYFSVFRRHLKTEPTLIAPSGSREFLPLLFAFDACSVECGQIWAWFSNKIWARLARFGSADLGAVFRTHRSPARSGALRNCEICQRPAQAQTGDNPTLFSLQHFFMTRAVLKHKDLVTASFAQKLFDPVRLVRGFLLRQDLVTSCSIKAVARLPNITNRSSSRIAKSIDEEAANVLSCHVASSFARRGVKNARHALCAV